MAGQTFHVRRPFLGHGIDDVVDLDDIKDKCDVAWLVKNGSLKPLTAGPHALMGGSPSDAVADVSDLHDRLNLADKAYDALRKENGELKDALSDANKKLAEIPSLRSELAAVNENNDTLGVALTKAREEAARVAEKLAAVQAAALVEQQAAAQRGVAALPDTDEAAGPTRKKK